VNVDLYERIWLWAAAGIIVVFLVSMGVTTFGYAVRPPSHVEMIDPTQVMTDPSFGPLGASTRPDGSVRVAIAALMFAFVPAEVHVPVGRPVTFRISSLDVSHGFDIAGTNANTMVLPGYLSQFTYTFQRPGEYLVVCNEYCGLGHHTMQGKIVVEAAP
jgi:cytochrome c oxidase subunit 2